MMKYSDLLKLKLTSDRLIYVDGLEIAYATWTTPGILLHHVKSNVGQNTYGGLFYHIKEGVDAPISFLTDDGFTLPVVRWEYTGDLYLHTYNLERK